MLLKYIAYFVFILPFLILVGLPKKYQVKKINQSIQITGKGTDKCWKKAKKLTDFSYPWRVDTPPPTQFKALYSDTHFYFLYWAADTEIIQKEKGSKEMDIAQLDRVELFFKGKTDKAPYYALELDALGGILDTEANFYKKIDLDWTWPAEHLVVKAQRDRKGYWVEGSISFASLRNLGLYNDDGILRTGLYRAEYVTQADGVVRPQWISWIQPNSELPNFHIPSSFGILELIN